MPVVGKQVDFGSVAFSAAIPMLDNKLRVLEHLAHLALGDPGVPVTC
jgi:hypothetical protein